MSGRNAQPGSRIIPALLFGYGAWWALDYVGPVIQGRAINIEAAILTLLAVFCGVVVLTDLLALADRVFGWMGARTPRGDKGKARFVRSLRELGNDAKRSGWGPYWGVFRGCEIIADFVSNALTVGPAGVGKGIKVVLVTIVCIRHSKTVVDFKGELACVLAVALRLRGEIVRILNFGDMWLDILGLSDTYNHLNILADDFERPGGLLDVADDAHEMSLQLLPEKAGKSENQYFDDGARNFIEFGEITSVLIHGRDANFGHVAQLIQDRAALLRHAQWACGRLEQADGSLAEMDIAASPWVHLHDPEDVENFIAHYRALASGIADLLETSESRTADSFITGAQQALRGFSIASRAHRKSKSSSFRFTDQKEGDRPLTVFIVVDSSRINAMKPVVGLTQWCMMTELKRHPNKKRPVYLIADEATNFKLHDLGSLMTWGRGYGIRLHLIFQSIFAFVQTYGKETLNILLSETEIKQFLPGQRDPETLDLIEKMLARQSYVARSHSGDRDRGFGVHGHSQQEDGKPLMTADEIRRTDKGLLFIGRNRPLQVYLPSIAEISPFRDQIGINPFHGKPFRKRVRLHINRRDPWLWPLTKRLWKSMIGRNRRESS